tara:strand:+ start:532 stop:756 length:225 start_codon:yes stop_codon:yes gene_type:complete
MKVPKKILKKILEMSDGHQTLSRFNAETGKWEDVEYDPSNETHLQIKEAHLAEVEIMCIIEALRMGVIEKRELD